MTAQDNLSACPTLGLACWLIVFGASWLGNVPVTHADESPTVMLVIDGSGSMWGKLGAERQTKLALTQRYVIEMLTKSDPRTNFGLASFGHRRPGNCSDAQVIVPPAPGTVEDIVARLEKHNPRGKGPLSLALKKTGEAISPDTPSTVVLIHDGYDNCRQDPCQIAGELAASHPKMTIHLISLDLPDNAASAMSCVAKTTGGTAQTVRSAAELKTAVQSVMALLRLQPPTIAKPPSKQPDRPITDKKAAEQGPPRIRLTASFKTGDNQVIPDVSWRVLSPANRKFAILERQATELAEKLAPGDYIVQARAGLAETDLQITVKKEGEVYQRAIFDAGILVIGQRPTQPTAQNIADPTFLTLRTVNKTDSEPRSRPIWIGTQATNNRLVVPPGAYKLDINRGHTTTTVDVSITSGQQTKINTDLDGGILSLDSVVALNNDTTDPTAERASPNIFYVISTDDPTAPGGRRELARSTAPQAKFQLQPGTVYAAAQIGQAKQERRFAIGAGQVVQHQFQFDVANVDLRATVGSNPLPETTPVQYKVFSLDSHSSIPLITTSKHKPKLVLATGRYRVEANVAGKSVAQSTTIDVQPNRPLTAEIALDAGLLTLRAQKNSANHSRPTRYQVRSATGDVVWRGRPLQTTTTLLKPGSYTLEVRDTRKAQRDFTITSGSETVIELTERP